MVESERQSFLSRLETALRGGGEIMHQTKPIGSCGGLEGVVARLAEKGAMGHQKEGGGGLFHCVTVDPNAGLGVPVGGRRPA